MVELTAERTVPLRSTAVSGLSSIGPMKFFAGEATVFLGAGSPMIFFFSC